MVPVLITGTGGAAGEFDCANEHGATVTIQMTENEIRLVFIILWLYLGPLLEQLQAQLQAEDALTCDSRYSSIMKGILSTLVYVIKAAEASTRPRTLPAAHCSKPRESQALLDLIPGACVIWSGLSVYPTYDRIRWDIDDGIE